MGGIGEHWRDVKAHNKSMDAIKNCQVAKDVYNNQGSMQQAKQVASECSRQQKANTEANTALVKTAVVADYDEMSLKYFYSEFIIINSDVEKKTVLNLDTINQE